MDKEEFSNGRFYDFPAEDLPELSGDGLSVLHEFISQGEPRREERQHSEHPQTLAKPPFSTADLIRLPAPPMMLPSLAAASSCPIDRMEAVGETQLPNENPLQLQRGHGRLTVQSSSSKDLTDDASTQPPPGQHLDSFIRERNRAAQKRFRERQKAKQANHGKQVEELNKRMQTLEMENERLKTHCKLLKHEVYVNSLQHTELQNHKEDWVNALQQEAILKQSVDIYRRGIDQPTLSIEDTKMLTVEGFLRIFEIMLRKYKLLLESGAWNPGTPAHKELEFLVQNRRVEEARLALFSSWTKAILVWNREEAKGQQPPSASVYATVLNRLNLLPEQQEAWLAARRKLLEQMSILRLRRDKAALAVGMLVIRNPQAQADGTTKEEIRLRNTLEEEREAVLGFLFSCLDCCLSAAQEATLDVMCYPWWPCVWTMCNILARKHKKEPPDTLAETADEDALFLQLSSARILCEPVMARMGGLLMKRTYFMAPIPHNVVQAVGRPTFSMADLRSMTVFEVMCGKHLQRPEHLL